MFNGLLDQLLNANTTAEINHILYTFDGVDMLFQKGKLTAREHERLFKVARKLEKLIRIETGEQ